METRARKQQKKSGNAQKLNFTCNTEAKLSFAPLAIQNKNIIEKQLKNVKKQVYQNDLVLKQKHSNTKNNYNFKKKTEKKNNSLRWQLIRQFFPLEITGPVKFEPVK